MASKFWVQNINLNPFWVKVEYSHAVYKPQKDHFQLFDRKKVRFIFASKTNCERFDYRRGVIIWLAGLALCCLPMASLLRRTFCSAASKCVDSLELEVRSKRVEVPVGSVGAFRSGLSDMFSRVSVFFFKKRCT